MQSHQKFALSGQINSNAIPPEVRSLWPDQLQCNPTRHSLSLARSTPMQSHQKFALSGQINSNAIPPQIRSLWPDQLKLNPTRMYKGKDHPRTVHEGPEREKRYGSTLSLTKALGGGGCLTHRPGRFIPGKHSVPIVQEGG
jgi:hypothetical protein